MNVASKERVREREGMVVRVAKECASVAMSNDTDARIKYYETRETTKEQTT